MDPNRYFDLHQIPCKSHCTLRKCHICRDKYYSAHMAYTTPHPSIHFMAYGIYLVLDWTVFPNFSSVFTESLQLEIYTWPPFTPNSDETNEFLVPMEMLYSLDWYKSITSWFWLMHLLELYTSLEKSISTIVVFPPASIL